MSVMLSENFGDLLDARIRMIFDKDYAELIKSSMIPMLFGMKTSTRAYEIVSAIGGMGDIPEFDGSITYDTLEQLYDKTFTFPEKAGGLKIERKLYDDDMFGVIDNQPWQMAVAKARTREKTGANMFINAFVGTDGADGVCLCSTAHPYSPGDATTQSNKGTSAASATSVEATRRIGLTSIKNNRGNILEVNYDTIVSPVALHQTFYEIIESSGKVDTADNNVNFLKGRFFCATWPRLTSSTNWFMLDSTLAKKFLLWWDRLDDGIKRDQDTDTMVAKWYTYERYSCGWADWRPVYGHLVA